MAFLLRVLSGKSLDVPREVRELREEFRRCKDEIFSDLIENADVRALVEMIHDSSDREAQYFLKFPTLYWLKENPKLVLETISVLSSQDAPFVGRLGDAIDKHGLEAVSDIILELFNKLSTIARQIDSSDSLADVLDYGWQLGSPLSSRQQRPQPYQLQRPSKSRSFPPTFRHQRDGADNLNPNRCMADVEPLPTSPPSTLDNNDGVNGHEQYRHQQGRNQPKQVAEDKTDNEQISTIVGGKNSAGEQQQEQDPSGNRMRVIGSSGSGIGIGPGEGAAKIAAAAAADSFRQPSAISSRAFSSRRSVSYGGSEFYTTDSDDDSFSASSHMSLLVAVSEAHEAGSSSPSSSPSSSSGDDSASEMEARIAPDAGDCTGIGKSGSEEASLEASLDPIRDSSAAEPEMQIRDAEFLEDKLPICSSVVLSSKSSVAGDELHDLSFYAPEMWTYSEGNDTTEPGGGRSDRVRDGAEQDEDPIEEVKVVIAPSVEDKYVSVYVRSVTVDSWGSGADQEQRQGGLSEEKTGGLDSDDTQESLPEEKTGELDADDTQESLPVEKTGDFDTVKFEDASVGDEATAEKQDSDLFTGGESSNFDDQVKLPGEYDLVDPGEADTTDSSRNSQFLDNELDLDKELDPENGKQVVHSVKCSRLAENEESETEAEAGPSPADRSSEDRHPSLNSQLLDRELDLENGNHVKCSRVAENEESETEAGAESETEAGVIESPSPADQSSEDQHPSWSPELRELDPENGKRVDNSCSRVAENETEAETEAGSPSPAARTIQQHSQAFQTNGVVPSVKCQEQDPDSQTLKVDELSSAVREQEQVPDSQAAKVDELPSAAREQQDQDSHASKVVDELELPSAATTTNSPPAADSLERLEQGGDASAAEMEIPATPKSESSPKRSDSPPRPETCSGMVSPPYSGLIPLSGPMIHAAPSHSGAVPYSGSLSLRSDSSTNSTRSFAFPILSTEWNSSPVKMAPPDRHYMLQHRRRSWRSLCCFCPAALHTAD